MELLELKVYSISSHYHYDPTIGRTCFTYRVNFGEINYDFKMYKYDDEEIEISNTVTEISKKVNQGVRLALFADGKFGYIKEDENACILPFRYDFATSFNEYGLAMAAKDGYVSWINKDFKYISSNTHHYGEFVKEKPDVSFEGFNEVSDFMGEKLPLSRIILIKPIKDDQSSTYNCTSYLTTRGNLKSFYEYDGSLKEEPINRFENTALFDNNGYAISSNSILSSEGYFSTALDIFKIANDKGLTINIMKKAEMKGQLKTKKLEL